MSDDPTRIWLASGIISKIEGVTRNLEGYTNFILTDKGENEALGATVKWLQRIKPGWVAESMQAQDITDMIMTASKRVEIEYDARRAAGERVDRNDGPAS